MTADDLKAFEQRVAEHFNAGHIRAPVHLAGGNEEQLIEIFKGIRRQDYVLSQWRSHYHCLLKGVPPDSIMADILDGRSITLTYPTRRVITSAIVGGILPIALGIAASIHCAERDEHVWAFIGDMTQYAGICFEVTNYAARHNLPLTIVVEDNGLSVQTPTEVAWGKLGAVPPNLWRQYQYNLPWPHSGAGKRVDF
jgi:pyruvate dehydrogenase E1 component alpha subunit